MPARGARVGPLLGAVLVVLTAAGCTVMEGGAGPGAEPRQAVTVTAVVDGDTVRAAPVGGGAELRVRILGIDAPETRDPDGRVECWARESTEFGRGMLLGRTVSLVGDPTQDATDRYGRTLGYLLLGDGGNFSVLAAAAGAVRTYVYDRPVRADGAIRWAEAQAWAAGRGLWGACPAPAGR